MPKSGRFLQHRQLIKNLYLEYTKIQINKKKTKEQKNGKKS